MEAKQSDRSSAEREWAPHALPMVVSCNLLILIIYAWFISVGTWTHWPASGAVYDQLAESFARGHTWLEQQPSPQLLALSNPYNPLRRKDLTYPIDFSLYLGRYYLYFGPAPALLILAVKPFYSGVVRDPYLAFLFTGAIAVLQSLFIVRLWRHFFRDIPQPLVAIHILVAALVGPFTPSLGRPDFHFVAVASGQAFFLAGLYFVLAAIDGALSRWRLLLAGLFFAAAVACRISQAVPIAFILLLLLVRIYRLRGGPGTPRPSLMEWLPLLLPLGIGAALLGWYNWVRFGSVFETGYRYQLAGNIPLKANMGSIFGPSYVLQNIRNYLINPPTINPGFPYLGPARGMTTSVTHFISLPRLYDAEWIMGLLFGAPVVLLALVPLIQLLRGLRRHPEQDESALLWLIAILVAASLGSLAVLLPYFWVAERFLADFIPALLLLSTIGSWQIFRLLRDRRYGRTVYSAFVLGLMAASVLTTSLLAVSMHAAGFRQLNPVLWHQINSLVGH